MKKLIGTLSIFFTITAIHAEINAVVSILPQKTFVGAIGGDKVAVTLMVKPGNSPHNYEPKPSQMKEIAKADIYFTIGVEFEEAWLDKFADQNKKMKIVHIDHGIAKIEMEEHHHDEQSDHEEEKAEHGNEHHHDHHEGHGHNDHKEETHHDEHDDHHDHQGSDPHVWTSPLNVKILAKNIYNELVKLDAKNKEYYKTNYEKFLTHIDQTDREITKILSDIPKETKFMVFHPAWGYFARDYGLTQIAIEAGGKNPKPKQVMYLIKEAKEEKVKAVFTAPEFSDKVAKQIATEVGVPVIKASPLNPSWSENLINLAKAIGNK